MVFFSLDFFPSSNFQCSATFLKQVLLPSSVEESFILPDCTLLAFLDPRHRQMRIVSCWYLDLQHDAHNTELNSSAVHT